MSTIQAIRGMQDLLPDTTPVWQYLESQVAQLLKSYAYQEIRFPIVEQTELFKRSIGEVTDIVEKEMYSFEDRNGDNLTLRPEGTAGCVRACLQNGLLSNQQPTRLWYTGPMFRRERPQKGRQRQFHQIGVETFGMPGPDIDAEMILITARLWKQLGLMDHVSLQLNSIGSLESRAKYKEALVAYLEQSFDQLDEDSQRRLATNPLRILDSKNEQTQSLLRGAPDLLDYLDDQSREHFDGVKRAIEAAGIAYEVNSRLVRGLDYYCNTVFEWVTNDLGAQGTVCAGGRYDGLVAQLGGKPCPAVGFAMGIERLCLLLEATANIPDSVFQTVDAYLVVSGDEKVQTAAVQISESLRDRLPQLRLLVHCGGGSMKSQMKKADKSGAAVALILGASEAEKGILTVKPLRAQQGEENQQMQLDLSGVYEYLEELISA